MDDEGGIGEGSFRVKHGSDAAEVTDVHEAGAGEVGDVVGERETRIRMSEMQKLIQVVEYNRKRITDSCKKHHGHGMVAYAPLKAVDFTSLQFTSNKTEMNMKLNNEHLTLSQNISLFCV